MRIKRLAAVLAALSISAALAAPVSAANPHGNLRLARGEADDHRQRQAEADDDNAAGHHPAAARLRPVEPEVRQRRADRLEAALDHRQPFAVGTGYQSLAVLRDCSNADKHRLLHATLVRVTQPTTVVRSELRIRAQLEDVVLADEASRLEDGDLLASFRIAPFGIPSAPDGRVVLSEDLRVDLGVRVSAGVAFTRPGLQEPVGTRALKACLADASAIVA